MHQQDIVEVIVRKKIRPDVKCHIFPRVKVALRKFNRAIFGTITNKDKEELAIMFDRQPNEFSPFYARAFYRRFIDGARDQLCPFPWPGL